MQLSERGAHRNEWDKKTSWASRRYVWDTNSLRKSLSQCSARDAWHQVNRVNDGGKTSERVAKKTRLQRRRDRERKKEDDRERGKAWRNNLAVRAEMCAAWNLSRAHVREAQQACSKWIQPRRPTREAGCCTGKSSLKKTWTQKACSCPAEIYMYLPAKFFEIPSKFIDL